MFKFWFFYFEIISIFFDRLDFNLEIRCELFLFYRYEDLLLELRILFVWYFLVFMLTKFWRIFGVFIRIIECLNFVLEFSMGYKCIWFSNLWDSWENIGFLFVFLSLFVYFFCLIDFLFFNWYIEGKERSVYCLFFFIVIFC